MEKVEIINVENRKEIDKINFIYPELMSSDAEDFIKNFYKELQSKEEELHLYRERCNKLEGELKTLQSKWGEMRKLFTYTHPSKEKVLNINKCTVAIQGHGNDIIGRTTVM